MTRRDEGAPEVHSITGAASARSRDLDRRVNRYLISMAIRTACVVLVFVVPGPARWVFAAGAVFLPYVAVLFANASGRPAGPGPAPVDHRGLGAAAHPDPEVARRADGEVRQGHRGGGVPSTGTSSSDTRGRPRVVPGEVIVPSGPPPSDERRPPGGGTFMT